MISNILSFLGGVGAFAAYISNYFNNNDIRNTQKEIDELKKALEYAIANNEELEKKCEQEKMLIAIEYDQKIDEITAEINAANPRVGGREIIG